MTISCLVPMAYVIKGVLGGQKGIRSHLFAETAQIEIDEVGYDDAPVAVSWTVPGVPKDARLDYFNHTESRAYDGQRRNHTVYHRGRHWLRMLHGHVGPSNRRGKEWDSSEGITLGEFLGFVDLGRYNDFLGFAPLSEFMKLATVGGDPEGRFTEVRESDRPRSLRSLARLELLSVDGLVYVACDQPAYALASSDKDLVSFRYPYVTARRQFLLDNPRIGETRYLPFSMGDEFMQEIAATPADVVMSPLDVQIHLPETISQDEDLKVGADYHVRVLSDAVRRARKRQYPDLAPYFGLEDIDEKAEFIASARASWPSFGGGLSPAPLDTALAMLDEREIALPVHGGSALLAGP
ncbi:hypothetical protein O9X98_07110 [Agrobacterium salinitolerans]|nr:hypothetical protein [Agrobacterium salinitolerans]